MPATAPRRRDGETALEAFSIKSGAKPASGPETLRQEARYGAFPEDRYQMVTLGKSGAESFGVNDPFDSLSRTRPTIL